MGVIILVSGPSGAGKDTIINAVVKQLPDFQIGFSLTTRAPEPGDTKYHYAASLAEFDAAFTNGELLERDEHMGAWYGKLVPPNDGNWILELDVHGAEAAKAKLPDAYKVLIIPPGQTLSDRRYWLEHRIRERAKDSGRTLDEDDLRRRLDRAPYEIDFSRQHHPDLVIVNGVNLNTAIEEFVDFALLALERVQP